MPDVGEAKQLVELLENAKVAELKDYQQEL